MAGEDVLLQLEAIRGELRAEMREYWEALRSEYMPRPLGAERKPRAEQLAEYQTMLGADEVGWGERIDRQGARKTIDWVKAMRKLSGDGD